MEIGNLHILVKKEYEDYCTLFYCFNFYVNFTYIFLSFDRLGTYGLTEFQIEGDGNCQVC